MKKLTKLPLLLLLLIFSTLSNAQNYCNYPEDCLFWEIQEEEIINETEIIYANNVPRFDDFSCGINTRNLKLDMHYPNLEPNEIRPLVIVIHGGGFYTGDKSENTEFAQELASYGYVVANINYRLCEKTCCQVVPFDICDICYLETKRTHYIATIDALTAAQYLIANAGQYNIDPNTIFYAGNSAGAVLSLTTAYLTQDENEFSGLVPCFGELPIVNNIKGIASISGAVLDTSIINFSDSTAAFMVHGTCDQVVVYDYGGAYNCNNFSEIHGSANCAIRMQNEGLNYQMFTGVNMDHNAYTLFDDWFPELLNFFRRTLCEETIQTHTIVELSPPEEACSIISQPIVSLPNVQDPISSFACDLTAIQSFSTDSKTIKVFPNPASNFISIQNLDSNSNSLIKVLDLRNQCRFIKETMQEELTIPIANWAGGIYFVQIKTNSEKLSFKIIVD